MTDDRYWLVVTVLVALWAQLNETAARTTRNDTRSLRAGWLVAVVLDVAATVAAVWFLLHAVFA